MCMREYKWASEGDVCSRSGGRSGSMWNGQRKQKENRELYALLHS